MTTETPTNSQRDRLLSYLQSGNKITRLDAFNQLGIVELSARIIDLQKDGFEIQKEWITVTNRFKEKVRVVRYSI